MEAKNLRGQESENRRIWNREFNVDFSREWAILTLETGALPANGQSLKVALK